MNCTLRFMVVILASLLPTALLGQGVRPVADAVSIQLGANRPEAMPAQVLTPENGTLNTRAQVGSPERSTTDPSLPPSSEQTTWPQPIGDAQTNSYILFDLLEYQRLRGGVNAFNWSASGWRGGDVNRFWIKSEGSQYSSSRIGGEFDVQALYGRLITPYFDLQTGFRYEMHMEDQNISRTFAVVALQGLAPYRFEIEPELFLSNRGKFSGRFTASTDWLVTQRLILQPRIETEFAFQQDNDFRVDRGFNTASAGMRLRYEIRREFAPYAGVAFLQDFGATKTRTLNEGGTPNQLQFVFGVRMWH